MEPARAANRFLPAGAGGLSEDDVANRDVLAVGTSAGGVEALIFLAKELPRDLPASVLVTIHLPSYSRSSLDDLLTRAGRMPAHFAVDGESLQKSHI